MAALDIAVGDYDRTRLLWLLLVGAGVLFVLAVAATMGGPALAGEMPAPEADDDEECLAEGFEECPRCGGAGTCDLTDDEDRVIAFDVTCTRCGGAGVMELWF